jgi:hypothetical protein
MAKRAPIHPGEILEMEFLDELGLSAYALARASKTGAAQSQVLRARLGAPSTARTRRNGEWRSSAWRAAVHRSAGYVRRRPEETLLY